MPIEQFFGVLAGVVRRHLRAADDARTLLKTTGV
jgi:hypothetical protein